MFFFNFDVHRASFVNQSRSKKHLENIRLTDMIIPDWLFRELNENFSKIPRRIRNPKTLKQIAGDNFKNKISN